MSAWWRWRCEVCEIADCQAFGGTRTIGISLEMMRNLKSAGVPAFGGGVFFAVEFLHVSPTLSLLIAVAIGVVVWPA
ncbi:MAG: hypothetical protein ACYC5H_17085 [Methylovirgula sp.]